VKTITLSIAAAIACAAQAQAATYHVSLKSAQNGKYVRAGVGQGTLLAAVSPKLGGWEDFQLVELGKNRFALRSVQNGKYVRAGVGQGTLLAAVSNHIAGWETFEKIELGGNRIAIRSVQNGKYVRAGVGQGTLLAAVSNHIAGWETFEIFASSSTGPAGPQQPPGGPQQPPVFPPPPPPAPKDLTGAWTSNIFVTYHIKKWGNGYLWEAPQLNQVGEVRYCGPGGGNLVRCRWWDNNAFAGSTTGSIIRNAQGTPVQIRWNNGVVFQRK